MLLRYAIALIALTSSIVCSDPDVNRGPVDMIKSRGFQVQSHYVTTKDGYILALYRIVSPKFRKKVLKPVILQHALLGSCLTFITNSPGGNFDESLKVIGNNLGFELAKRGYDVWLANSRGSTYSQNHTKYNPNTDRKYWEFSFDEMAEYDLPSTIDYVRAVTKSCTVGYIGHSQGTLIMFILLSQRPEYNKIVKPFIALAPLINARHATGAGRSLAYSSLLLALLELKGGKFVEDELITSFSKQFCSVSVPVNLQALCANAIFFLGSGYDSRQLNYTRVPVYTGQAPAGTSVQNMLHFAQIVRSDCFCKYDRGERGNMVAYGSKSPPAYPVERISNKYIALFSSENDGLADTTDVQILRSRLRVPLLDDYVVPDKLWTHLDFIWGKSCGSLINSRILDLLHRTC